MRDIPATVRVSPRARPVRTFFTRSTMFLASSLVISRARWASTVFSAMPSFAGDPFVGFARQDTVENVALSAAEARQQRSHGLGLCSGLATGFAGGDRPLDRLEQDLAVDGLLEKVGRAGLHRPDRRGDIAVARHHDHRQVDLAFPQLGLQLEAAHAGKAHVDEHASSLRAAGRPERNVGAEAYASVLRPTDATSLSRALRTASSSSMMKTVGGVGLMGRAVPSRRNNHRRSVYVWRRLLPEGVSSASSQGAGPARPACRCSRASRGRCRSTALGGLPQPWIQLTGRRLAGRCPEKTTNAPRLQLRAGCTRSSWSRSSRSRSCR